MTVTIDDLRTKHQAAKQARLAGDVEDYRQLVAKQANGKLTSKDSDNLSELLIELNIGFEVFEKDVRVWHSGIAQKQFADTYDAELARIDELAVAAKTDVDGLQKLKFEAECRLRHATGLRNIHIDQKREYADLLRANPRLFANNMELAAAAKGKGNTVDESVAIGRIPPALLRAH